MSATAAARRIDGYLSTLRGGLKGLTAAETEDVVEEVRAHLMERLGETPGDEDAARAVLSAFGEPVEIARLYRAERLADRLQTSRSPWAVAMTVLRLATLSLDAFFVFLGSFTLYALSLSFLATAVIKPFAPANTGLWVVPDDDWHVSLGYTHTPVGDELLGWRLIPIALVAAVVLGWLAWRFSLAGVRRLGRQRARLSAKG
jgi:hypothetical protein